MYDVHKLTGVVSFALLIVIAMTGAYWGFTPQYEDALAWLTQGPAREKHGSLRLRPGRTCHIPSRRPTSADVFGLHFGTFWGHPSRVLWLILGLVPLVLFSTGVLMWWNRTLSKKVRRLRSAHSPRPRKADAPDNVAARTRATGLSDTVP